MKDLEFDLKVYLIDDDKILLQAISQIFELEDIDVVAFDDPTKLLHVLTPDLDGVVITDVRMNSMDGIELYKRISTIDPDIPVTFITGHADVPMVLNTLRSGAFDFFSKPIDSEHLLATTRRALATRRLVLENRALKQLAQQANQGSELIGESAVIERLRSTIQQLAPTDIDVLLEGETGTGKEVAAKLIHQLSSRANRPMITINCAALPSELAEVELFGSSYDSKSRTRGARIGKIEASNNGTLFLDEIESLSMSTQGQLLPVVEDRQVVPAIGERPKDLNLRIVSASQIDLSRAAEDRLFRRDLLYRLNAVKLEIPPLRDRKGDIPLLFAHFVNQASHKYEKDAPKISAAARRRLLDYDWPGNVRELKNFAYSIALGIEEKNNKSLTTNLSLPEHVERFEANTIRAALEQVQGDVREALELLGIPRKTFYDKLSRHDIDIKTYRERSRP